MTTRWIFHLEWRETIADGAAPGGLTINHRYDGIPAAQAIELAVVRQRRDLEGALGAAMIGG